MRISDWSSDVCSSDLHPQRGIGEAQIEIADRERSNVMDFKLCQWALCHRVNPRLFWPFILADVGDFPNIPESSGRAQNEQADKEPRASDKHAVANPPEHQTHQTGPQHTGYASPTLGHPS